MKSALKKFEKNSIDMSKVYGGYEVYDTGRANCAVNGVVYSGTEYVSISEGCATTWWRGDNGLIAEQYTFC